MRHNPTDAEQRLWQRLRAAQVEPYKFRRQYPIGPYIADFACMSHRVAIEADGGQHAENPADAERTAHLEKGGWKVLRFWNNDILQNIDGVLQVIIDELHQRQKPQGYISPQLELCRDE